MRSEQPSVGGGRFVHRQEHWRFGRGCPAGAYSFQRVTDRFSVQCFRVCVCDRLRYLPFCGRASPRSRDISKASPRGPCPTPE